MSPPNDSTQSWVDESAWRIDPEADRLRNADFKTPKTEGTDFSGRGGADIIGVASSEDQWNQREVSPEQKLWVAILLRAFLDAFHTTDSILIKGAVQTGGRRMPAGGLIPIEEAARILRTQSRAWLVSSLYREDRRIVCDLAGRDEKQVRETAKRLIAEAEKRERHATILKDHIAPPTRPAISAQKVEYSY